MGANPSDRLRWIRAYHAYRDRIADLANKAFEQAMKRNRLHEPEVEAPAAPPEPVRVEVQTSGGESVVTLTTAAGETSMRCPAGDERRILEAVISLARGALRQARQPRGRM